MACEGLAELGGAGGGRLDDDVLVVRAVQAGTASSPPRAQTGQADLVEPVDHIPHRVLVRLDQLGDHQDPVPATVFVLPRRTIRCNCWPSWSVGLTRRGAAGPRPAPAVSV